MTADELARLGRLGECLRRLGWQTELRVGHDRPHTLIVRARNATVGDSITIRSRNGVRWFWSSLDRPLAPVSEMRAATQATDAILSDPPGALLEARTERLGTG
ncbi:MULTISPECIES: hypothetical protein [Actinomadura]|uniref:Uncharacterized protein n=1 Tax=Actinomadura yumaensis TaxID=111807 RepID=A0ABW2CQ52_9ACTN|nr:hypothetical protein [Actinomadura sp. J1-007]MWK35226.1 hypothetical protein [Actinomadura sp. J1-007]